jgi:agmatinase
MPFDPDAAAAPGTGIFGLPYSFEESKVVLLPVPFDATTSYARGTAAGPEAIRTASAQVDLFDRRLGRIYERGIFMHEEDAAIRNLNDAACTAADPVIECAGIENMDDQKAGEALLKQVADACERVNAFTYEQTMAVLKAG